MKISEQVYFYQAEEIYPELKLKKYEKQIRPSNPAVIKGEYQILIDPGFFIENRLDNLIEKLAEDNLDLKETKEIWLTHFHYDHVQAVRKLVDFTKAKACCHGLARDFLEKPMTPENLIPLIKKTSGSENLSILPKGSDPIKLVKSAIEVFQAPLESIKIDKVFKESELIVNKPMEIHVLGLAGHSPDEIGFWLSSEKVLITGDVFRPRGQQEKSFLSILNNIFSDADQALESLRKIKSLFRGKIKPEVLLLAHGSLIKGEKEIENFVDKGISQIKSSKRLAGKFLLDYPELSFEEVLKKFTKEILPKNPFPGEEQFLAFTIFKSLKKK